MTSKLPIETYFDAVMAKYKQAPAAAAAAASTEERASLDAAVWLDAHIEKEACHRDEYSFPSEIFQEQSAASLSPPGSPQRVGVDVAHAERDVAYMCGNSLGLQHRDVQTSVNTHLDKWRQQAVEGHFMKPEPWFESDDDGAMRREMASLVGALASEVVIMNTLTANLHLLLAAFYDPCSPRRAVLIEADPFPSDMYAIRSHMMMRGVNPDADDNLVIVSSQTTEDVLAAIDKHSARLGLVLLGTVHFLTGLYFDVKRIAAKCREHGITLGLDCAHAAGNVDLKLHEHGVDFAAWCTYKYLNGGPGNIAALYVHERHTSADNADSGVMQRQLRGWWGHARANRFALKKDFTPSAGAASFQLSNPCIVSLASLRPSVELMARVGIPALRARSLVLTGYLEALLDTYLVPSAVEIVTPRDPTRRGAQLSLRILPGRLRPDVVDKARSTFSSYKCGNDLGNDADLVQYLLKQRGVVVDNRPPDIIRVSPAPLYNTFQDVWHVVAALREVFLPSS
eukprot:PhM_4_TR7524/c0_g3_i1/m.81085/K01556/KYNU, kynU; kynureninase